MPVSGHLLHLPGGAALDVRPIAPSDRDGLAAFFADLSAAARDRRFLGPKPALSARELTYLTELGDDDGHRALVAVDRRTGDVVAEARSAAWPRRPGAADLAFVVRDDLQRQGLGRLLAGTLVALARDDGLGVLTASTGWDNAGALGLLRGLGFRAVGSSGGVVDLELPLLPAAAASAAGCVAC